MKCNICGGVEWGRQGKRENVRCLGCNSLERTRAIMLHLARRDFPKHGMRTLHIAPERGIAEELQKKLGSNYHPVDLFPKLFPHVNAKGIDLCSDAEALPQNHYDLILHSHVIEHVPCNWTMVLMFLHRALKPGGLHVFSLPIIPGGYDETLVDIGNEERIRRFGQNDHVRRYGRDDIEKSFGMVFKGDLKKHMLGRCFSEQVLNSVNIPRSEWDTLNGSTVFVFEKDDLRIAV